MEGYSVEDKGKGICFCVYAYNVQPRVKIDYKTGESNLKSTTSGSSNTESGFVLTECKISIFVLSICKVTMYI